MFKEKFAKLVNLKTIMTLMFSLVFCVLTVLGKIGADQFMIVFTTVIGFYFGRPDKKEKESAETATQ